MSVSSVTFLGKEVKLSGSQPDKGEKAPNARLLNHAGEEVMLADILDGEITIISVVPDVQTRTCELQTRRFAEEAKDQAFQYITVGRNTVEEFNDWNADNDLNVATYSDYQGDFGLAYGLEINLDGELKDSRAVFVVGKDGKIHYKQIVQEVADEPDYAPALQSAKGLVHGN
ncbi:redoxin family protein [Hutsoniella sourekii]|uniref:redoxin family protein n=1 Tax=Hutsoniella sourekii TaxID=87650 RepID=UPI0004B7B40C|nr:redoxin family protein [Hutsoniella sourekii]